MRYNGDLKIVWTLMGAAVGIVAAAAIVYYFFG